MPGTAACTLLARSLTLPTAHFSQVDDRYEVKKKIGQGAYGLICAATDRANGETVAVKKIANAFEDAIDCKRTLREVAALRRNGGLLAATGYRGPTAAGHCPTAALLPLTTTSIHPRVDSAAAAL